MPEARRTATDPDVVRSTAGLIAYLRELVRSGRQPVRDCARYQKVIWLADLPAGVNRPVEREDGVLLTLDYVPRTPPPGVPDVLMSWLDDGAVRAAAQDDPPLAPSGPVRDGARVRLLPLGQAPQITAAYQRWLPGWRAWAATELLAAPRRDLYQQLARIARRLGQQDDTLELVVAAGLLGWRCPEDRTSRINRHLLTARVDVAVDRVTNRLTVALATEPSVRLEDRDFLDRDDGFAADRATAMREQVTSEPPHPLGEEAADLLERWHGVALDHAVRHDPGWAPADVEDTPSLSFAPALILRDRDRNAWVEYYDRIIGTLSGPDAATPLGLAQLLYPLSEEERLGWSTGRGGTVDRLLGDDPLFPLPTNPAQRSVLDRLQGETAVVVQGPPGTGKTHTIANLISALLAQGQRVLVTSQKDQALRVLRDQLPGPVGDLCVLLTSRPRGGPGGVDELERTITALSERTATSDPDQLRASIDRLRRRRADLRQRCAEVAEEIRVLREAETVVHPEVAPGYAGQLAAIVELVTVRRHRLGWIGAVPSHAAQHPPLSVAEAVELRRLLAESTPDRELRRDQVLPELGRMPGVEEFAESVRAAAAGQTVDGAAAVQLGVLDEEVVAEVGEHLNAAADALHRLGMPMRAVEWPPDDWRSRALLDHLAGRNSGWWDQLARAAAQVSEAQKMLNWSATRQVAVPPLHPRDAQRMRSAGAALRDHLAAGGTLRRHFAPQVQRDAEPLLESCTVDGRTPASADDLAAVVTLLDAEVIAARLAESWAQAGAVVPAGPLPLRLSWLADQAAALDHVASLGTAKAKLDAILLGHGIRLPIGTAQGWDEVTASLGAVRARVAARLAGESLARLVDALGDLGDGADPAPELVDAARAAKSHDVAGYERARAAIRVALGEQEDQRRCDALLDRLRAQHPGFADRLVESADEPEWEARLAELPEAWAWGIAGAFCATRTDPLADRRLQLALDDAEQQLARVTGELAAAHAWLHCVGRITQEQRQALQAYKNRMAAYGKGTSKRYAGRYRKGAREAMTLARGAVPAWVMPLSQVVATIPPEPDAFDVVIVDEASQVGVDGLFLQWLAPRVIVVGDDKQCAPPPTTYGELQKVFDRLDDYLPEVSMAFRDDLSPKANLYELLSARFPHVIRLTEHFRCMPEIIGWSSSQFYDGRLVPLRQFGADRLAPLEVVTVEGGYVEGRDSAVRNPIEAKAVVAKLQELLGDPRYAGRTFAVAVLQGSGQVRLVEDMIVESIEPDVIEARGIRVGSPAEFQGDERDVMLLSMVVAEPARALGGLRDEQRRFNVAASRARDQMWLFTSVRPDMLRAHDLRHSLLTYMQNVPAAPLTPPGLDDVRPDVPHRSFDSLFEQEVFLALRARGFHVLPQVPVDAGRIDLVVVGAQGRLAVECDGRVAQAGSDELRADIARERELRRVGWQFWRVRESEFRLDPDRALDPLWTELEQRGITPGRPPAVDAGTGGSGGWAPVALPVNDDEAAEWVE